MDDLAIVILHFQTPKLTDDCLKSIFARNWKVAFKVYLVDNGSDKEFQKQIRKLYPKITVLDPGKNLGFSKGNNLALNEVKSKNYLLLNSDTVLLDKSLDNLYEFASNSEFDIVSCKLLNKDGSLQPNTGALPNFFSLLVWLSGLDDIFKGRLSADSYQSCDPGFYQGVKQVGWVSGSVMLVNGEVFKKIGLLDENIFMYGEDVEFCLRAEKAKFKVGWTDQSQIYHLSGGSSKLASLKQWLGEFQGLLYISEKYYGGVYRFALKVFIYFFVLLRVVIFLLLGKIEYSKTYVQILRLL